MTGNSTPQAGDAQSLQRLRAIWTGLPGALGVVLGLTPHVLHHVGILVGTAFIAGAGGTALFAALGLAASIPFLLRLRRKFNTWLAPAIGLGVFVIMFSLSAFVIGPAINKTTDDPTPGTSTDTGAHSQHHQERRRK